MDLTIIVSICTIDDAFVDQCLTNALAITPHVIASFSDKLFNGEPEDMELINKYRRKFQGVVFCYVPFDNNISAHKMHNRFRSEAYKHYYQNTDWILFLDADEILDVKLFKAWAELPKEYDSYSFKCYWYFRLVTQRAKVCEEAGVLIRKGRTSSNELESASNERWSMCKGNHCIGTAYNGIPMLHHFSWVRTKEQMLKKVQGWGHKGDRDWAKLVEKEFSMEPSINRPDFVHGYELELVEK